MKSNNPMLLCVIYCSRQAYGESGAQMPMCGGHSYLPVDEILTPPAKDIIEVMREESYDYAETQWPNRWLFLTMQTGSQKFERNIQRRICREQENLEVIQSRALGLFPYYKQSVVADENVVRLRQHDHIVNPPAAGSLTTGKRTGRHRGADSSLWGWNALAGRLFKDLQCGWIFFTLFGGWTDGWLFAVFGQVLGLCFVFCILNYYIGHIHQWRAVLTVHDVGINHRVECFRAMHTGSHRTQCMAIMQKVVRNHYPTGVSVND